MTIDKNRTFATLSDSLDEFTRIRRDLHKHPETAFEETRTSDLVAKELESYGLEVHRGLARTGVVATLRSGPSERAIGLRADLDALPMDEANEFDHRSCYRGKMHGCGHDGHTTMLLAAARYLSRHRDFDGTVHFIFQPAEENEGGGRHMVEQGLFDLFPMEAVFGMHNMPGIPLGDFAVRAGPIMGGFDVFDIVVRGQGSHAAMPHYSRDPLLAAAAIVTAAQSIVARNVDPMQSAVVSVTQFHGGSAYNVIPDEVRLAGTARYFLPAVQDMIERRLRELAENVAKAHEVTATVSYQRRYPATVNTAREAELCRQVLTRTFGEDRVDAAPVPMLGSEDFAFMLEAKPGCYIWAGNGVDSRMVHHPKYDFSDDLIPYGATYWVELVKECLPLARKI